MKIINLPGGDIEIKPVAVSFLSMALLDAFPRPKPPIVVVDYGNGEKIAEANSADPDYINRVIPEWEANIESRRMGLMIKRGTIRRDLTELEQLEVASIRDDFSSAGVDLKDDDWMVWVKFVACQSDDDLLTLLKAISTYSSPITGAQAVADGFRGDA